MNRSLENALLLALCCAYALVRGPATGRMRHAPKRVCIMQFAQLGDMICTTPMFRAVKKAYPQTRVFVVGKAINKEVLAENPDVDDYVVWENNPWKLIKQLRRIRPDFGAATGPNFIGLATLFLAGVPRIAAARLVEGTSPLETRPYRILCHLAHVMPHTLEAYAPREYLRLLEPIGIRTEDTHKHLAYTPEAERSALRKLHASVIGTRPFAVIAPGAGHPAKRWPPERFAALADYIAERYMPAALIGGANDREDTDAVMKNVRSADVVSFGGEFSIDELKAFIPKASLFISVDTGPIYIAETFGVPTIDILGPASGTVQPPIGPKNIVITPPREAPAMTMFNTRVFDVAEAKRQAEATPVSEVIPAVDTLLLPL